MTALKDDVCRCHDDACVKRYSCARWIHRETGAPHTPHSWSLYPLEPDNDGLPLSAAWPEPCENLIEVSNG